MKGLFLLILFLIQSLAWAGAKTTTRTPAQGEVMEFPYDPDPEWPVELIDILKIDYERNSKASFCIRPIDMVDTVVIHHSETPSTSTAKYINELHLARGTADDPWYMIAYSYVINSPYPRGRIPLPLVTEGRPLELVGAHAGSNVFVPMDDDQKKMWEDKKILCGKENEIPAYDESLVKDGKIKANVTTVGIVVNGNYAPFSKSNPGGYSKRSPRYPTDNTQDMIARLSCQLQKKYPRIKSIMWHSYYHSTTCPGTIKSYIGRIKTLAKGYGCEFN